MEESLTFLIGRMEENQSQNEEYREKLREEIKTPLQKQSSTRPNSSKLNHQGKSIRWGGSGS